VQIRIGDVPLEQIGEDATMVARGASYFLLQSLASTIFGVVYFAVLARFISEAEMGWYTSLSFLLGFLPLLATLGLNPTTAKFLSQHLAEGKTEEAGKIPKTVLLLCLPFSLAISLLCLVTAPQLSLFFMKEEELELAWLIQILALAVPFAALSTICSGFLQGLQEIGKLSKLSFFSYILARIAGFFLLRAGLGLAGILVGWILGNVLTILITLIIVLRRLPFTKGFYPTQPLLSFSMPLLASSVLILLTQWMDRALVILYVDPVHVGIYNVAATAWAVLMLVPTAILTALFPKMSELHAQHGKEILEEALEKASRYVNMIHIPLCVGLTLLAFSVIPLFAGEKFAEASIPYMVMALGAIPYGYTVLIYSIFVILKRNRYVLIYTLLGILADALVGYMLIPRIGIVGAAMGNTLLQTVGCFSALILLRRAINPRLDRETLLKVPAATIGMVVVLYLSQRIFTLQAALPLHIILGILTYLTLLILLKTIHGTDLHLLDKFLPSSLRWISTIFHRLIR